MRLLISALIVALVVQPAIAEEYAPLPDRLAPRSLIEDLQGPLGVAPGPEPRAVSSQALRLVRSFEGWSATAYDDPAGYCTIGFGHLIALARCETINLGEFSAPLSLVEGQALLEKDTRTARTAIEQLVRVELNDNQFGALVSFTFNVGKGNLARSSILTLINAGQSSSVPQEFARWVKAGGKILPGLVIRRACEALLFQGVLEINADRLFDPRSCKDAGAAPSTTSLIDIEEGE